MGLTGGSKHSFQLAYAGRSRNPRSDLRKRVIGSMSACRSLLAAIAVGIMMGVLAVIFFPARSDGDSLRPWSSFHLSHGESKLTKAIPSQISDETAENLQDDALYLPPDVEHPKLKFPRARPGMLEYAKPTVYFDIAIGGVPSGRITFQLFTKQSPLAAENFRALCTGEKGSVPNEPGREGAGQPLHFKGKEYYRVIDAFICQTGAFTESIYGGQFKDDPGGLLLKHTKKGLLSMANMGHDTNTSHFSILMAPAPHLDGNYVIFGEVVSGMEVVDAINALAKPAGSEDEKPRLPVVITDSGELDCSVEGACAF